LPRLRGIGGLRNATHLARKSAPRLAHHVRGLRCSGSIHFGSLFGELMTDARHDLYAGCEVVCVDASTPPHVSIPLGLAEGAIYTIRWIGEYNNYVDGPFLGVRLVGINRGKDPTYGFEDPPFHNRRFKPLIKDKLASLKQIAADPDGWKPDAKEGPLHPNGPLPEPVRERETV
tara:strand:- start:36725 stop:37246 length:522 start_codon:yes stop_codon:yes gene_type:complete